VELPRPDFAGRVLMVEADMMASLTSGWPVVRPETAIVRASSTCRLPVTYSVLATLTAAYYSHSPGQGRLNAPRQLTADRQQIVRHDWTIDASTTCAHLARWSRFTSPLAIASQFANQCTSSHTNRSFKSEICSASTSSGSQQSPAPKQVGPHIRNQEFGRSSLREA
jgi:hypothetical protein